MISSVEALRYRCLRDVRQRIAPFQVLVGPNASGKSTFLDVPRLLADLLRQGLPEAVRERSPDVRNLVWMEQTERFEVAVELTPPTAQRAGTVQNQTRARYEAALGHDDRGELAILAENLWLLETTDEPTAASQPRASLLHTGKRGRRVVSKEPASGKDLFSAETSEWSAPFRFGPRKLALASLPEDEERFPFATWVKRVLLEGVRKLVLRSEAMSRPSPPGSPADFQPDGSNLPWLVETLRTSDPERFERWLAHVQTALPDVRAIETTLREEDRHRYLRVEYATGHRAPSWTISDGTLRLLALTLLAYLDPPGRVFLIEEPENGIHPQAIECVFQALSSVYESQILCASHSPAVLALAEPHQLLCFSRAPDGATAIVRGDEHPLLKAWRRDADLGTLFASGVLG